MKVTLEIDGELREVVVDPARATVTVSGQTYPFQVIARTLLDVELEIAGERVRVTEWPADLPTPAAPVSVDGERFRVVARVDVSIVGSGAVSPAVKVPEPSAPETGTAHADAIRPPMPGKVIEVRVREGDRVAAGTVLLVLEAMKMRNEIASPRAGVVRELRVSAGSSVRGKEPMLRVVAEP